MSVKNLFEVREDIEVMLIQEKQLREEIREKKKQD